MIFKVTLNALAHSIIKYSNILKRHPIFCLLPTESQPKILRFQLVATDSSEFRRANIASSNFSRLELLLRIQTGCKEEEQFHFGSSNRLECHFLTSLKNLEDPSRNPAGWSDAQQLSPSCDRKSTPKGVVENVVDG